MNVQQYIDLFERQTRDNDETFYSFKLSAINKNNNLYSKLSQIIKESELDKDSAYTFTVEALEAIKDMGEVTAKHDLEDISSYSEAPIYNSELMDWVSKGTNYVFVDEVLKDFGNDIYNESTGIIGIIQMAYTRAWEENYYKVLEMAVKA